MQTSQTKIRSTFAAKSIKGSAQVIKISGSLCYILQSRNSLNIYVIYCSDSKDITLENYSR